MYGSAPRADYARIYNACACIFDLHPVCSFFSSFVLLQMRVERNESGVLSSAIGKVSKNVYYKQARNFIFK